MLGRLSPISGSALRSDTDQYVHPKEGSVFGL